MPKTIRRALAVAVLAVLTTFPIPAQASEKTAPPEFVALSDVAPTILHEIRYHGRHNFVGRKINGYVQPLCLLTRQAAEGLRVAQRRLPRQGYTLKVYDCYRPQRAVDHFVRWAKELSDERMKAEFYPNVAKDRLFADGYIAEKSGHSRGSTVDLTIVKLPPRPQRPYRPGEALMPCFAADRFPDNMVDMGTGYDCFDTLSHTGDPRITGEARANRQLLKGTLAAAGFRNLAEEWWHYTLNAEPFPDTYFDFPVARHSLTCAPSPHRSRLGGETQVGPPGCRIAFSPRNAGRPAPGTRSRLGGKTRSLWGSGARLAFRPLIAIRGREVRFAG